MPLVDDHAEVVAVDLPSTRSIEHEADAVAALIDRPAVLVGHSRGGLVATQALAPDGAHLAAGLILVDMPVSDEAVAAAPLLVITGVLSFTGVTVTAMA